MIRFACFQESQWSWATQLSSLLFLKIFSFNSLNMAFLIAPINYFSSPLVKQHERQVLKQSLANLQKYINHNTSVLQTAAFTEVVIFSDYLSVSCNKENIKKQTNSITRDSADIPLRLLTSNIFNHFLCYRVCIHIPVSTHACRDRQRASFQQGKYPVWIYGPLRAKAFLYNTLQLFSGQE